MTGSAPVASAYTAGFQHVVYVAPVLVLNLGRQIVYVGDDAGSFSAFGSLDSAGDRVRLYQDRTKSYIMRWRSKQIDLGEPSEKKLWRKIIFEIKPQTDDTPIRVGYRMDDEDYDTWLGERSQRNSTLMFKIARRGKLFQWIVEHSDDGDCEVRKVRINYDWMVTRVSL